MKHTHIIIGFLLFVVQLLLVCLYWIDENWYFTSSNLMNIGSFQQSNFLSDKSVNAFVQDKKGYIWIGTDNGLNVYSGNNYKQLFYSSNDSSSISDNRVLSLLCDKKDQIWVGTSNGVAKHIGCFQFKRFEIPHTSYGVYQLIDFGDRGILANNGESVYLITDDKVEEFYHFEKTCESSSFIYPDFDMGFWIIQPTIVKHYNNKFEETKSYIYDKANMTCPYLCGDTVWFNQSHRISAIDLRQNELIYSSPELPIIATALFVKDNQHLIISSSFHGLYVLNINDNALEKLPNTYYHLHHKEVNVATFFADVEDNLWIGYRYGGFQVVSKNTMVYDGSADFPGWQAFF